MLAVVVASTGACDVVGSCGRHKSHKGLAAIVAGTRAKSENRGNVILKIRGGVAEVWWKIIGVESLAAVLSACVHQEK